MRSVWALAVAVALAGCKTEWRYQPVEGAACGRGGDYGLSFNRGTSKRLVLVFQGGGACYDEKSCAPDCIAQGRKLCAANLQGFDGKRWRRALSELPEHSIFDRDEPANPFRADSFAFLGYCTGDFHSGRLTQPAEDGVQHRGFDNVSRALKKIVPAFAGVDHVVLYGVSAGGYGVLFNFEQVRAAFPESVRVDAIDDSGPPLSRGWMPRQEEMSRAWGNLEPDWANLLPGLARRYPRAKFAFVSYTDDPVIRAAFEGPIEQPREFARALEEYKTSVLAPLSNVRVFYRAGPDHVVVEEPLAPSGLGAFLTDFVSAK